MLKNSKLEGIVLTKSKKYIMHRGMLSLIFAFALSVSAVLSPLVRAEESSGYTWKDITIPGDGYVIGIEISRDSSKLFAIRKNYNTNKVKLYVSADDGENWDSFDMPDDSGWSISSNTDGSKLLSRGADATYLSTNGGRNWSVLSTPMSGDYGASMSPDGSTLVRCGQWSSPPLYVSVDNGQTWTQKGNKCPKYIFDGGKMIAINTTPSVVKRSNDYGLTWTDAAASDSYSIPLMSVSTDGNKLFDGHKISLDGGVSWAPIPTEIPTRKTNDYITNVGISDDGKRLFACVRPYVLEASYLPYVVISVDGGKTWMTQSDSVFAFGSVYSSSSMSKMFAELYSMTTRESIYRLTTLPRPQPVVPGSAGGTATPTTPTTPATGSSLTSGSSSTTSTTSTSTTSGNKPEKSSSNLAETGVSVWLIGGLAVAAVAGGLVLRKRL